MTPETPLATPPQLPAHLDRSGWLIVFGIFDVVVGLVLWLMAALASFALAIPDVRRPQTPAAAFVSIVLIYGGLGTVWIVLGVASALRRNWARVSLLVLSSCWALIGVLVTILFAVIGPATFREASARTPNANLDPNSWKFVLFFMVACSAIFMVLLPFVLALFYSRPNVTATCSIGQRKTSAPSRPVLINILAGWFFVGAAALIISLPFTKHAVVFGLVLGTIPSALVFAAHISLYLYSGWSFVKLRAAGWIVATGSVVFWLTSGAVTLVTRNAMDLYREMEVPAQHIAAVQRMPGFTTFIQAFTLVIQLALLAALIWSKRYFGSPPQSTAASFSASASE